MTQPATPPAPAPATMKNTGEDPSPVDTTHLQPQGSLAAFLAPLPIASLLATAGSFAALFAGKCQWADLAVFLPIVFGVLGGTTAVTEAARHTALGKVLSSR